MYITRNDMERCGAMDEDCEGVSNYVVGIEGVEVAVFFRQLTDRRHWRASLRSKGTINVAEIAERFGGGGHTAAAGCGLPGPLSVASECILAQLRMAKRQTMQ
jgi:phosphoesterase RecJ-like protein